MLLLSLLACDPIVPDVGRSLTRPPLTDTDTVDTAVGTDTGDTGADTASDTASDTGETPVDTGDIDTDGQEPPRCGDDVRADDQEECDGAADDACPGRCSSVCTCPSLAPSGELQLHVLDVGQGDALLVVSPDGFTMLVDSGDDDTVYDLQTYLDTQGVRDLDYVVTSHLHADHMGAMGVVLYRHPEVSFAYDAGGRYDSTDVDQYLARAGDRRRTVAAGDTLDLGPSMDVEVLHGHTGDSDNENNNSVVLRLTYGGVSLLLGGDCEAPVCEGGFDPGPIDIYKVHHHGASDSSSAAMLDRMQPRTALISAGLDNSYGHPHEETLARLDAVGAEVWRTDLDGPLVVRADGVGWTTNGVVDP